MCWARSSEWHHNQLLLDFIHIWWSEWPSWSNWCCPTCDHTWYEREACYGVYNWRGGSGIKADGSLKIPRPWWYAPLFYQNYWSLIRSNVTLSILHYLNNGVLSQSFYHSFITLIPKVKNLEYVTKFRPISLSNVLYRIFSKVLANRLKTIMPQLISEH